jgi:predicted XRE-type DNA-binding protein
LNVNQAEISALLNYRLCGFSVERLMNFLVALGHDVDVTVRPNPESRMVAKPPISAL